MFIWDTVSGSLFGFLLVLCRVSGIFTFNPIFSRNNVPNRIKAAMSVAFGVVMLNYLGGAAAVPEIENVIDLVMIVVRELFVGVVFGFFTNLLMTVMTYAGEIIDTEVGLGMAKAYDPGTGVTMPVFANFYYYLFIIYFFITDGHLSYIKLFSMSYDTIPLGYDFTQTTIDLTYVLVMYMGNVFTLGVKFALPLIAAEMIVEVCIGIIMKAIPNIQVAVINVQLKLVLGFIVLLAAARPMSEFLDNLLGILWENLYMAAKNFV